MGPVLHASLHGHRSASHCALEACHIDAIGGQLQYTIAILQSHRQRGIGIVGVHNIDFSAQVGALGRHTMRIDIELDLPRTGDLGIEQLREVQSMAPLSCKDMG